MNKYETAIDLMRLEKIRLKDDLNDQSVTEDQFRYRNKCFDLAIEALQEKSAEFEYNQKPQVYRDAQDLFNAVNPMSHNEDEALIIEFHDKEYDVIYLEEGYLEIVEYPSMRNQLEFTSEDTEYNEILQIIVETGLTKID